MTNNQNQQSPFDILAREYDAWFDTEGSIVFFNELNALQSVTGGLQKPWLEIGVGTGRFAEILDIDIGIDPSLESIKLSRQRGISVLKATGEKLPFRAESIGAIFVITTLCFVNEPLEVLKETNRVLVNGGDLILGLILIESPWGRLYLQKKLDGHRFYRSANFYSFSEAVTMLSKTCFSIKEVVSTLFQPPGMVEHQEIPVNGYFPEAGFTVIHAHNNPGTIPSTA